MLPGHGARGPVPGTLERVEGGWTPGWERAAPLALVVFREAAGWGEWKKGLAGEEGRGLRMSVFARLWEAWGSRSLEKGDLLC